MFIYTIWNDHPDSMNRPCQDYDQAEVALSPGHRKDNNSYAANPRSRDNETDRRPAMQPVHWDVSWWIVPLVNVNCSRLSVEL